MKRITLSVAICAALGSGIAQASPFIPPLGSPVFFQFNNLEQISQSNSIVVPGAPIDVNGDGIPDTPANEGNWGVFNISSIQNGSVTIPNLDISGGTTVFSDLGPGNGQISGIFYGITNLPSAGGTLTGTGGWIDLWWEDNGDIATANLDGLPDATDFDPADRTAPNDGGIFTDGTFLARLAFAPGIIDGDAVTHISSSFVPTTGGFSGHADSFADVVDVNGDGVIDSLDGVWAGLLNGDWFFVDTDGDGIRGEAGERRDLRFSNFFNPLPLWSDPGFGQPGGNDIVGARSNDPGRVFTVPEPTTVALLGGGLLLAGWSNRRRSKSTA